jgi:hypothetical protein
MGYALAFLGCTAFATALLLFLLSRPGLIESTSPDGRLVARVTFPSELSRLILNDDKEWKRKMRVRIYVTDTRTKQQIKVHDGIYARMLGDGFVINEKPLSVRKITRGDELKWFQSIMEKRSEPDVSEDLR